MKLLAGDAPHAGANPFALVLRSETDAHQRRRKQRALPLASCAIMAATLLMPAAARAVECSNGGTGPNPAGTDNGDATSTACGDGAVAGFFLLGHPPLTSYATAIGYDSLAIPDNSTAIGAVSTASGDFSTASGYSSTASGIGSTAYAVMPTRPAPTPSPSAATPVRLAWEPSRSDSARQPAAPMPSPLVPSTLSPATTAAPSAPGRR